MMNYIWVAFVVIAVIAGGVTGNIEAVLNNVFDFAQTAVDIALGLIGVMAFFCGLMKVMESRRLCVFCSLMYRQTTLQTLQWLCTLQLTS